MLEKISLHNFRTYLNAEVDFTSRHLIIGRNNSGKTNLYAALRFLCTSAHGDFSHACVAVPGGISELRNWTLDSPIVELSLSCKLPFQGRILSYQYDLHLVVDVGAMATESFGQDLTVTVKEERLVVESAKIGDTVLLFNDGKQSTMLREKAQLRANGDVDTAQSPRDSSMLSKLYELETNRRAILFKNFLSKWFFFSFNPEQLRFGWRGSNTSDSFLSVNGHNLAFMLYNIKNVDERRYRRIINHVRLLEPDLEAINFIPSTGQVPIPFIELKHRRQATWDGLSDGTLRCLAMAYLAEIVRANKGEDTIPSLIFIEEPENGLFPGQLRTIFDQLFEDDSSSGQFIFTSHSPYFINFFDSRRNSVSILRKAEGRTTIAIPQPPDDSDPDRPLLAEEFSMELDD